MTIKLQGIAPMKMTLEWDGTDEELIALATEFNGEPLDSDDLGDAMGVLIVECAMNGWELSATTENGRTLNCAYDFDAFKWTRD